MTLLPPGFRFHPTDVELIKYYLKRKLLGKRIAFDAIAEVDIYKYAPWDLPGKSRLDGGDRKWYFFCSVKKYGCGVKSNRSTGSGYWKSTGKDRPVSCGDSVVGMVKTLVFHMGKSPKGERTDWVMYEYRIERKELGDCGVAHDGFVVCAVFKKDGLGPRVGAHYGALFREEDWDNEDKENCTKFSGEAATPDAALMAAVDSRNCSSPSLDNLAVCSFEPRPPVPPYLPSGYDVHLPQIAHENDDILSMLAMLGEDDTSHLSGQVEDRVDCGNTCTNSASIGVDIYFGLEDLENIGPLADSFFNISGPFSAKDSTDQLYGEAQFLELMDLDMPLGYSKDAAQDETLEGDTFVDYHNYGSETQQPYYLPAADANFGANLIESATVCDQQNGGNRKVDLLRGIPSFDNVNSATQNVQVESGDAQKSFSRGDDPHSSGIMFCHYDGSSTHVKAEVTRTIIGSTKDALSNKLGESSFTFLEVEFGKGTASSNTGVMLMFFLFCIFIALINGHLRSMSYCVMLQQSLLFIWFICRGSSILRVMSSAFHHVDECASFGSTICLLLFNCCFLSFHFGCYLEGYNLCL